MKATVLIDNIGTDSIKGEWGLAILIEYNDKKILLDTGASNLVLENAKKLGVDLTDVDYGVLSHAHYDHSDGMDGFFDINRKAKFFVRKSTEENVYDKFFFYRKYIGIQKGILKKHKDRIEKIDGDYKIDEGIYLIPHKIKGLDAVGKKERMYLKTPKGWKPDDFSHEQSLVFETEKGLVVFNSCSHGGADNIIREIMETFPDKQIIAMIGGFHLYNKSGRYVREFSRRVKDTGIQQVYTGHCTGKRAYRIMKEELGEIAHQLQVGLIMEF